LLAPELNLVQFEPEPSLVKLFHVAIKQEELLFFLHIIASTNKTTGYIEALRATLFTH